MKNNIKTAAAIAAMALAGVAQAQYLPSGWSVGVGATTVSPNTKSGNLGAPSAPGTQIDVGSDTQPTVWVRGMFGDHFAVEVPIGAGFKQSVSGAGAISGVGQIGTIKALPITVLGQYHFLDARSQFRPYLSLGVTYAKIRSATGSATLSALNPLNPAGGTGLSVDSKWAGAVGGGVSLNINERWYADLSYLRVFLKTQAHLSTGQSIDVKLNPDVYRIGVGYKF
ncbi:MAG TPA: OmpW family outer membrane protein [Ramlibacter sp.]|nr:OmpW family outer membrane protein [Ramlibacter sp.]